MNIFVDCWDVIVIYFLMIRRITSLIVWRLICRLLKPGDGWLNLQSWLYHFFLEGERSLELSYVEIRSVIKDIGYLLEVCDLFV